MNKPLLLLSASLCALTASLPARPAQAWTCPSRCAWYQPSCLAQLATCAAATETCRTVAFSAAVQVQLANAPGQPLALHHKQQLRPFFGDLVDRVTAHYGALLVGETYVSGERLSWGYSAQTFGHDIYLAAPLDETENRQLSTLAHELVHAWQYEQDQASGNDFFRSYCRAWVEGGFSYEDNAYEQQAQEYTHQVSPAFAEQSSPPGE